MRAIANLLLYFIVFFDKISFSRLKLWDLLNNLNSIKASVANFCGSSIDLIYEPLRDKDKSFKLLERSEFKVTY